MVRGEFPARIPRGPRVSKERQRLWSEPDVRRSRSRIGTGCRDVRARPRRATARPRVRRGRSDHDPGARHEPAVRPRAAAHDRERRGQSPARAAPARGEAADALFVQQGDRHRGLHPARARAREAVPRQELARHPRDAAPGLLRQAVEHRHHAPVERRASSRRQPGQSDRSHRVRAGQPVRGPPGEPGGRRHGHGPYLRGTTGLLPPDLRRRAEPGDPRPERHRPHGQHAEHRVRDVGRRRRRGGGKARDRRRARTSRRGATRTASGPRPRTRTSRATSTPTRW